MTKGQEIMAAIEKHAPRGYDPHSDDMTVPFAIKLAEQDAEIERLRAAIRAIHHESVWMMGQLAAHGQTPLKRTKQVTEDAGALCNEQLPKETGK